MLAPEAVEVPGSGSRLLAVEGPDFPEGRIERI